MMRTGLIRLAVVVITLCGGAAGTAVPQPIDLASLDDVGGLPDTAAIPSGEFVLHDVAFRAAADGRRFYVTGILGTSFATLSDPFYGDDRSINGSIFTTGGAAGIAWARDNGQWRFEIEGRGRDDLTKSVFEGLPPLVSADLRWVAADGWSATANVWRDWWIGERWACYLGGGIGGGGYRYSLDGSLDLFGIDVDIAGNAQVAALAWQAGGGVVYEFSDRVSFDVGYRFFSLSPSQVTYVFTSSLLEPRFTIGAHQFAAGELLFSLRVYEPFRRWR